MKTPTDIDHTRTPDTEPALQTHHPVGSSAEPGTAKAPTSVYTSPVLSYGRSQSSWKRIVLRSLAATALVAILYVAIRYGPRTVATLNMLHWQSSCSEFDFPPDTLIYSEDPADTARLSSDSLYHTLPAIPEAATRIFRNIPRPWEKLHPLVIPSIIYPSLPEPTIILFVHQRTKASGISQLVVVGLEVKDHNDPTTPVPTTRLAVVVMQMSLGSFHDEPRVVSTSLAGQGARDDLDTAFTAGVLRFFAGKADPYNRSKFTIPWEFNGIRHQIQGTIEDETMSIGGSVGSVTLQDIP